ncbi:MAG: cyclic nucleotide-binding domain-containing protein [Magnetospirillum sp. WYHS-4]
MAKKQYRDGDVIFREGDPSDSAYVIEGGAVELSKASDREPVQLARLKTGEMFGEMGILDGSGRSATAVAAGKVKVREIGRDEFLRQLETDSAMALSIIRKLVQRLRAADEMLAQGSAKQEVARLRRDPTRATRPGLFGRLFGGGGTPTGRIEVRISQLPGERGAELTKLLADTLGRSKGLSVRPIKEILAVDASVEPPRRLAIAAETGRQWLGPLKADLLIWGEFPATGASVHLRFVSALVDRADRAGLFSTGTTLVLPANFPPEFGHLLAAVALAATVVGDETRTAAQRQALAEALEAAQPLMRQLPKELVSKERAAIQNCYGNAVATLATLGGPAEMYQVAAHAYRSALEGLSRDHAPLDWAMAQRNLGCVLMALAERTNDSETLGAAANLFRSVLQILTRAEQPFEWATTQARLGQVLYRLDLRTGDVDLLKEALAALQGALQVIGRHDDPLRWADLLNSFAQTAQVLGGELRHIELLERAVSACESALQVRTRTEHPQLFAATQNNRGSALFLLGRLTGRMEPVAGAADAFRQACEVYRTEGAERMAAIAEKNLAHVEETLPARRSERRDPPAGRRAWFEDEESDPAPAPAPRPLTISPEDKVR